MDRVVLGVLPAALALAVLTLVAPAAAAGPESRPGERLDRHLEALDLAPGQMERVQAIVEASRAEREATHARLRQAYDEMHALLEQEPPDEEAVMRQAERIGAIKTDGRKAMLRTLLHVRTELTLEQRRKLMEMKRERHGGWWRRGGRGGPPED